MVTVCVARDARGAHDAGGRLGATRRAANVASGPNPYQARDYFGQY